MTRQRNRTVRPSTSTIYDTDYSYDMAGNLLTLQRNGLVLLSEVEGWANPTGNFADLEAHIHYGQIDDLVYHYDNGGSLLTSIVEDATGPGKPLGVPTTTDIQYDGSRRPGGGGPGREPITGMPGKELEVLFHNVLNLPAKLVVKGKKIEHSYDGSGATLRQAQEPQLTEREDGKITGSRQQGLGAPGVSHPAVLEDGKLVQLQHADGRLVFDQLGTHPVKFQYKIQDHLGNTVVYFEDINEDGEITDDAENSEVLQRELYYPFGMPLDNYWSKPAPALTPTQDFTSTPLSASLYNGKEYETTRVGWGRGPSRKPNWYFYGARWYDPAVVPERSRRVGRFTGPSTHDSISWSHTLRNPVDPIAAEFVPIQSG